VTTDPRERFTGAADLYDKHRPSYPPALVDWILMQARLEPGARIADVGCGTGISTRLFAERGYEVFGVDPNQAMLERARAAGGPARYVCGEAAATSLPDASVGLVTVAQAFHWFDMAAALVEFRRILRAGGCCAAFWNIRQLAAGFMAEYDRVLLEFSREYHVLGQHEETLERLKQAAGLEELCEASFDSQQVLELQGFLGRVHSSSYVIHGVDDRLGFERALHDVFERHAKQGCVAFLYRSIALCFRLA
jgi:ubiquinone/menaquinone biosynthesis C-methylase UbiE